MTQPLVTGAAEQMRDRRRANAAPGGAHDRLVHVLWSVLPMGVGATVAVMLVTPLFPRHEVSFLLDRNKVAITTDRLKVDAATYRGQDNHGRAFLISAGNAVQHSAAVPVVDMQDLMARLQLTDGPASVTASRGSYDLTAERMRMSGPVRIQTADGYRMVTSGVAIDIKNQRAFGEGGVSGQTPNGVFSADRIAVDMAERRVSLDGRAHLRMTPGKITLPK